jgi:hypothetical protein
MIPAQDRPNSDQHSSSHQTSPPRAAFACSLAAQTRAANQLREVRKADLAPGDWVFVKTLRSTYRIRVKEGGHYEVSGGWFDQKSLSPKVIGITGCSWGGSAIKIDIVAACGLCLEFTNRLITSPIQKIIVCRVHGLQ